MIKIEYKLNADYPNYRTFRKAVMIRKGEEKAAWGPGYIAPELRYSLDGEEGIIRVRYEDIPFFTSDEETGSEHMRDILGAQSGKRECAGRLESVYDAHLKEIDFNTDMELTENEFVVPCTSEKYLSEELVSHKGTMLLKLSRKDYPVPDFCILNSRFSQLDKKARRKHVVSALRNLEKLTGSALGDAENPLVFAVRCAMPRYIPGLMPTFLNVGVTDDVFDALSRKHGRLVASKIWLNNMKTLYGLLYRDRGDFDTALVRGCLKSDDVAEIDALTNLLRRSIDALDPGLARDPLYQTLFFIDKAIEGFEQNSDLFYTFVKNRESFPSLILQKMVWTIIDNNSYPGVLYSRHSRTGLGRQVEFVRNIFGEEIMTGTIETKEIEYFDRAEIRDDFPRYIILIRCWSGLKKYWHRR